MKLRKFDVIDFLDSDEASRVSERGAGGQRPELHRQGAWKRSTRQREFLVF